MGLFNVLPILIPKHAPGMAQTSLSLKHQTAVHSTWGALAAQPPGGGAAAGVDGLLCGVSVLEHVRDAVVVFVQFLELGNLAVVPVAAAQDDGGQQG